MSRRHITCESGAMHNKPSAVSLNMAERRAGENHPDRHLAEEDPPPDALTMMWCTAPAASIRDVRGIEL